MVALGLSVATPAPTSTRGSAPPNVVVITLDTVRRDHMGCYGYGRPTTPRMDDLAGKGTLYTRAYCSSSWTIPTHASLFTGRNPFEHGAHAFDVPEGTGNNVNPLPETAITLAEILRGRGYATCAMVSNQAYLSRRWQINQGFDAYYVQPVIGRLLNNRVLAWVSANHNRPFFLFVNYMDAHRPYNTEPVPGTNWAPVAGGESALLDSLYNAVMPDTGAVPADLVKNIVDQYDMAVANVDAAAGQVVDRLRQLGIYDNTVIVVVSDHGEFFGEHHLVEHSKDLYEEALAAALIVKGAGQLEGATDGRLVSSTDVPGLILEHFPETWAGEKAQFPDLPGNHEVVAELYYSRIRDLFNPIWGHRFSRIRTVIIDWPFKFISSSDGRNELYDLSADPREAVDLTDERADISADLEARLLAFFAGRIRSGERVEQIPLTEDEIRRLNSLGYIE